MNYKLLPGLNNLRVNHFLTTFFACLIDLIYSSKNALIILDLTHPAQSTPPYGLDTVFCLFDSFL